MTAQTPETSKAQLPDPKEVAKTYAEIAQRASRLITDHMHRQLKQGAGAPADEPASRKSTRGSSRQVPVDWYLRFLVPRQGNDDSSGHLTGE